MDGVSIIKILLLFESICSSHHAFGEIFYITRSSSSFCPEEYAGEPCLTLQQYMSNPSWSSNVTLILESGNHWLEASSVLFFTSEVDYFTMEAENTKVIFKQVYAFNYFRLSSAIFNSIHLRGITFTASENLKMEIHLQQAQELLIENCSFQGIHVYLYSITNTVIRRSCFSNHYSNTGAAVIHSVSSETLEIFESVFINNTSQYATNCNHHYCYYHNYYYCQGGAVCISHNSRSVIISHTIFINNTSAFHGAAVTILRSRRSLVIHESIFVNNTAVKGEGGALYTDAYPGRSYLYSAVNITIAKSTFIYNTANTKCGVFSATVTTVSLTDSAFYYNRANGDGGAGCVLSAEVLVTNCSFIGNTAIGDGGALMSDNCTALITHTLFRKNIAGNDGGALSTFAHSSIYTLTKTSFIDNHAGDDGGAIFIGRTGSHLTIDRCIFAENHAIDRGGAVAIFGSNLTMTTTNVYNNMAGLGKSVSSCNSEVTAFISTGQTDSSHSSCLNYDSSTSVNTHDVPVIRERGYPKIIHPNVCTEEIPCVRISVVDTLHEKLQTTSSVAYTSLTLSMTVAIGVLVYVTITRMVLKLKNRNATVDSRSQHGDQADPVYEVCAINTDARDIEMTPNIVYDARDTEITPNLVNDARDIEMTPNVVYGTHSATS